MRLVDVDRLAGRLTVCAETHSPLDRKAKRVVPGIFYHSIWRNTHTVFYLTSLWSVWRWGKENEPSSDMILIL